MVRWCAHVCPCGASMVEECWQWDTAAVDTRVRWIRDMGINEATLDPDLPDPVLLALQWHMQGITFGGRNGNGISWRTEELISRWAPSGSGAESCWVCPGQVRCCCKTNRHCADGWICCNELLQWEGDSRGLSPAGPGILCLDCKKYMAISMYRLMVTIKGSPLRLCHYCWCCSSRQQHLHYVGPLWMPCRPI